MSVVAETPISSSVANGVTTVFPYLFTVLVAADLKVQGELSGVKTTYTLGVDYTLSGVGTGSGSVTFLVAPASGTVITRYRDTEIKRTTDYQDNGDLLAAVVNNDFDRLWLVLQEIYSGGKGAPTSLRVPNGETIPALATAASRANRVLAFDSSGDPITIPGVDTGSAAALALDIANNSSAAKGSGQVGHFSGLTGSVPTTVQAQLRKAVYVTDFGAKGDGVTQDDAPLFNAAIASGAKHIIVPWTTTNYLLLTPINWTTDAGSDRACGITMDFQTSTDLNPAPFGTCQIFAKHTGHVIDMAGSRDCTINNLCVFGDSTLKPKTLIFSARNSAASDCGRHRLNNVRSVGFWTVCPLYMYGTEETEVVGSHMQNAQPGKSVVTITTNNINSLSSTFITIATGPQSTTVNNFWGGSYWQIGNSGSVNETIFYLDGVGDINIDGPHLFCLAGISYVYISGVNQASAHIRVKNLRGEVSGANQPLHGIYLGPAAAPMTHQALSITDCRLPCGTGIGNGFMVYADTNINIASSRFADLYNSIGNGISFLGMVNSHVALQQSSVIGRVGGTVAGNQFIGEDSNIQLSGTNSNNYVYGEDTFTPSLNCTGTGNLNVTYSSRVGNISRVGRQVTMTVSIVTAAFTHTTATGQVYISGIPPGFASAAGAVIGSVGAFAGFTSAGFTQLGVQASGGTSLFLVKSGSGQALTNCNISDFPSGGTVNLYLIITYFV